MPLGRPARRIAPVILTNVLTLAASVGCHALPWSSRVPEAAEVKTRVEGDRSTLGPTESSREVRPTADRREAPDPIDEKSPLPPAIERPAPESPTATASAPTPLLDEALARAEARNQDVAETLAKDDGPKVQPAAFAPPPNPLKGDIPKPTDQASAPAPEPSPPAKAAVPAPVETTAKPPEPAPKSPEETWREGVQQLRAVAMDRLKEATKEARPGAPNWAVRERLLGWLAEPDIDPDARSSAQVAQGRAVLKGLAAVLDPKGPPSARGAEIREAVVALEAEAPLEIAELKLCRMVHGFGNIESLEPASRKAGQSVVLYSEIDGLAYEPVGLAFRSRVEGRVELIRDGSDAPAWSHALPTVEDACRRRRRDYFIGHKFTLPETLPPGHYRLRLTQKDLVADHVATRETTIAITK